MQPSDWINIVATLFLLCGIGVSLFLGLKSLAQTRTIQNKQFKNALLKDIIEWAIKVVSWRSENRTVLREMAHVEEGNVRVSLRLFLAHLAEVQDFFTAITGLNTYIYKISLKFKQGLPEDIHKLISDLKTLTDFNEAWKIRLFTEMTSEKANIDIKQEDVDKVDELAEQCTKSASVVLEKVADIKAKEIG